LTLHSLGVVVDKVCHMRWARFMTSCLLVTRPKSAAALQNCHFRNGAAGSDASQKEGSLPRQSSWGVYIWGATVAGKVN